MEYVGHLLSSEETSFTPAKRLEVLEFPLPITENALLQFIGVVNYFRVHASQMTSSCIDRSKDAQRLQTIEIDRGSNGRIPFCRAAVFDCQELWRCNNN